MNNRRATFRVSLAALSLSLSSLAMASNPAPGASLLMISVDGLKPEYVLEADAFEDAFNNHIAFNTRGNC